MTIDTAIGLGFVLGVGFMWLLGLTLFIGIRAMNKALDK